MIIVIFIKINAIVTSCACILTFECTANGPGSTVWKGTAFNCENSNNEIVLIHSRYNSTMFSNRTCNDGAIMSHNLRNTDNQYTSQLTVVVNDIIAGGTIECIHDTYGGTIEIFNVHVGAGKL